jgi:hypothetical protein
VRHSSAAAGEGDAHYTLPVPQFLPHPIVYIDSALNLPTLSTRVELYEEIRIFNQHISNIGRETLGRCSSRIAGKRAPEVRLLVLVGTLAGTVRE